MKTLHCHLVLMTKCCYKPVWAGGQELHLYTTVQCARVRCWYEDEEAPKQNTTTGYKSDGSCSCACCTTEL